MQRGVKANGWQGVRARKFSSEGQAHRSDAALIDELKPNNHAQRPHWCSPLGACEPALGASHQLGYPPTQSLRTTTRTQHTCKRQAQECRRQRQGPHPHLAITTHSDSNVTHGVRQQGLASTDAGSGTDTSKTAFPVGLPNPTSTPTPPSTSTYQHPHTHPHPQHCHNHKHHHLVSTPPPLTVSQEYLGPLGSG